MTHDLPTRTPAETSDGRTVDPALVFLAEDDDDLRALLSEALRREGLRAIEAIDGSYMLQLLRDAILGDIKQPDIVVMDVRMPRRSGVWLLEVIRRAQWNTPVLLITGFADPSVMEVADRLGARVLGKPFDLDVLRATVRDARLVADPERHARRSVPCPTTEVTHIGELSRLDEPCTAARSARILLAT